MSSKDDGPSGGPKKPGVEPSGSKKPTPLLDLKATEVKDAKADAAKAGATAAPAKGPESAKAGDAKSGDDKAKTAASSVPPVKTGAAADASKSASGAGKPSTSGPTASASGTSASGGAAGGKPPGGSDTKTPPPPPPQRSGGGIGSMFTHLVAGIVGGALVLFGAQPIQKQFGLKLTAPAEVPADITARLAAVERAASAKPTVDLSTVDGRISQLAKQVATIAVLKQQVATLAGEQKKLAAAVAASPPAGNASGGSGDLGERVAKLEETLKTLSNATSPDGSKSAMARLATISGKLSDLERTVGNQLEALRKNVMSELETRVAKTAEASAAAQAGTERIDRELAGVKTNAARLAQRAETLKATDDRLSALVRAVQEQTAKVQVELDGLKGDMLQQLKSVARPKDVASALAPVTNQVEGLAARVQQIVKTEDTRKANAHRIVLALELGNLKRALDRGGAYASELAAVKSASGGDIDLSALERFKSTGVPTSAALASEFGKVAFKIINAENTKTEGGVFDRLVSGAKSIVRVRRTEFPKGDTSTEAVVARIEKLVKAGDLVGAQAQAKALSGPARAAAKGWLDRLAARAEVDQAIAKLEQELKTSLGGTGQPATSGTKG